MNKDDLPIISTVVAISFYVYSLIMDVVVSFTVYKYDPYFFINHEANGYFVRSLSGDASSFALMVFVSILYIVLPSVSTAIYLLIDDKHKVVKRYCESLILMMDSIVFVVGILHIEGARSWISI